LTLDDLDAVCRALPAVTMVVQWGGSNVYKVGGKMFANADADSVSLKVSEIAYEAYVSGGRGIRAPYTQPGSNWLNLRLAEQDRAEVAELLAASHAMAAAKLTKKARAESGLG
jgi:predicted DNA-binding protein (MmcQ/YjbR family)